MERINQYDIYTLGQQFKALRNFTGDVPATSAFSVLMAARAAMTRLLKGNPTPLGISRKTATDLSGWLNSIWDANFTTKDADGKEQIKFPDATAPAIQSFYWEWMISQLDRFETVFQEDMREAAAYVVPRRGIYHTPALVDHADETFPNDLLPYIPEKSRSDFCAAGRCLAFNLLTASGYHVARAVEGIVEVYYQHFCGKCPDETLNGWKDYIDALKKAKAAGATKELSDKTIAELDQMREDYRNPLAHPRVVLNESEARMLFSNGESLIIGMAGELKKAKEASGGAAMALLGKAANKP